MPKKGARPIEPMVSFATKMPKKLRDQFFSRLLKHNITKQEWLCVRIENYLEGKNDY